MERTSAELQKHISGTYYGLRVGLAVIGFGLPIVVILVGGWFHHVWFEPSLSDYYHTKAQTSFLTTRDVFVGGLLAAGACLCVYKGFSTAENILLNLAGLFAVCVALLPTAAPDQPAGRVSQAHAAGAVLFFVCLASVSLFCAHGTLKLLPPEHYRRFRIAYGITGGAMVLSPLGAILLELNFGRNSFTLWVESLGVWAFSAYWVVKTLEMRKHAKKLGLAA